MAIGSIVLIIIFLGLLISIFLLVRNVVRNLKAIRNRDREMLKNLDNVKDVDKNEEKLDDD